VKQLEKYIAQLRESCASIDDKRSGANSRYSMADIGMAAFSMFFMQHPSFLAFQRTLFENTGQNNLQTLFGLEKIPSDNHIRKMLDGVLPEHFEKNFFFVIDELEKSNADVTHTVLDGHTLIALDGSEYYCSKKVFCPYCSKRKRSDGSEEYFHTFLSATIVRNGNSTIFCLPPEFIQAQDGDTKQDCEFKAVRRWFARVAPHCKKYNPIYLGDDLYAKHDICSLIVENGGSFIFTCKDSSHKTLHEFRKGLTQSTYAEISGKGSQKREYHYSWLCNLPIRDGDDAMRVNWIDVKLVNQKGKSTYHASFITDIIPNRENIVELIASARARWKIENETFNVLKNNGYHLEHNFGHGQQTLSALLVTLNLLAFTMHNACDTVERLWQHAREANGARVRLFSRPLKNHFQALQGLSSSFGSTMAQRVKKATSSPSAMAFIHFLQLNAVAAMSKFIVSPIVPLR
jgi:hypothetical protein